MKKKKVVAIAFSDLHYHDWKQYNVKGKRLEIADQILARVSQECHNYGVPALFTGDWYHTDQAISTKVLDASMLSYLNHFEYPKVLMYGISGNHDQSERNSYRHQSPTYLRTYDRLFSTFNLLDYSYVENSNLIVFGIPYNNGHTDLRKFIKKFNSVKRGNKLSILLLHGDLPGAIEPSGFELAEYENLASYKKMFSGFDIVLSGHIHKPQQLYSNVHMVGAPCQQRRSDMGCDMGIYKVYNDGSVQFLSLGFPEFRYKPKGKKKNPDDYHYWLDSPIEAPTDVEEGKEDLGDFQPNTSPQKLGKKYLKLNKVKDKVKIKSLKKCLK